MAPEFKEMPAELVTGAAKPTNPKDIVATTKLPLHLIPMITQAYLAIGHFNGLRKYGRDNWRASGVLASIYVSAALRHINSWNEGEELDPDDGVPHLMGAITSLSILIDAQYTGMLNDDRKYRGAGIPAQARGLAEAHIARLTKLHADRNPKHYSTQGATINVQEDIRSEEEETWSYDPTVGAIVVKDRPTGVLARPSQRRVPKECPPHRVVID